MKRFLSIICLLVVSVLAFSGCASVHYSLLVNEDGTVNQGFEINIDKQAIESAGYNYDQAKSKIMEQVNNIASVYRNFYRSNYQTLAGYPFEFSGVTYQIKQLTESDILVSFNFPSIKIYKLCYGITESSESEQEQEIEENFFYTKTIDHSATVFANYEDAWWKQYIDELLDYFNGSIENTTPFTLNDCEYNFYYGYPSSKLYSENSQTFYYNGIKVHHWTFDASQMNDEIITYTLQMKPAHWYILAIGSTFALVIVLFIIVYLSKRKQIKLEEVELENAQQTENLKVE